MLGDFHEAEERYDKSCKLLNKFKCSPDKNFEEMRTITIMINFNLAYIAIKKANYNQAQEYYNTVIEESRRLGGKKGKVYEMRAHCGKGHANRFMRNFTQAKKCFQEQLELAEACKDKSGKSQALCNLGMIHLYFKENERAKSRFEENLELVKDDTHLHAYAHSYMASISCSMNNYPASIHHYKKASEAFQEIGNSGQELSTIDLNLRSVYEKMGHRKRSPASQINFSG